MSKLPILSAKGDRVGDFDLSDDLLELRKGAQAVHLAVVAHAAARRAGTASTLLRGEVRGGGAKPWRQKGTGRARHGSTRSPIWRGGGVTFGPRFRAHDKKLTKKAGRLAFRRAFSEKVAAGEVVVIDGIKLAAPKTREMAGVLKKIKAERGALIVLQAPDRNVVLSARNLPGVEVTTAAGVHAHQLLRYPLVVVTKDGMAGLEARLKRRGAGRAS